jgi:predicted small secreted protein
MKQTKKREAMSMKKMVLLTALLAVLAGCNTIAGVGEDVSAGARTVQDAF